MCLLKRGFARKLKRGWAGFATSDGEKDDDQQGKDGNEEEQEDIPQTSLGIIKLAKAEKTEFFQDQQHRKGTFYVNYDNPHRQLSISGRCTTITIPRLGPMTILFEEMRDEAVGRLAILQEDMEAKE